MTINALVLGMYFSLLAAGFTLIFGVVRVLNFAHGGMYMFGAYFTYLVVAQLSLNYGLGIVAAVVGVIFIGIIFNKFVYKPVRRDYFASFMVALGLNIMLPAIALIIFGETERSVPSVFPGVVSILGARVSWERIVVIISCAVVITGLFLFVNRTLIGKAMRAVAYNRDVSALQGIDVERIYLVTFVVGSALAGFAGAILAPVYLINPVMGDPAIFKAMVVVILGGLGSVPGALVGGITLGFIESFGTTLIGYEATMLGWIIVITLICFRPWGLLGREVA
jgi:branched-chain amino acid transport system permease protein